MSKPHSTAAMRYAMLCCALDQASVLTAVQRAWVRARLANHTPLSPGEATRVAPALLAWSAGQAFEAALVEGMCGVVEAGLLSEGD